MALKSGVCPSSEEQVKFGVKSKPPFPSLLKTLSFMFAYAKFFKMWFAENLLSWWEQEGHNFIFNFFLLHGKSQVTV